MSEKSLELPYYPPNQMDNNVITIFPDNIPGETCVTTGKHNYKITVEHEKLICKLLATGLSTTVVSQEVQKQFGVYISRQTIHANYVKGGRNKRQIDRLRKELDAQLMSHPAKSQRIRLDLILIAINKSLENNNLKSFASLMRVLQIEVDGLAPLIDNSTHYHYTKMSDEKLIEAAREAGVNIPPAIAARIKQQIQIEKD